VTRQWVREHYVTNTANKTGSQPVVTDTDDVFGTWQPRYAERGIATVPVRFAVLANGKIDKVPMVQHWQKFGLRGSTELTRKFANAQGIGIALGTRNGLAVVDADTEDENVVADVLAHYGRSPLIARSPSGGYHVYYRHNGRQRRRIRDPYWRERGAPVDMLGNGLIVAPPSRAPTGVYRFVQGDIDDLQRLPALRASAEDKALPPVAKAKAALDERPSPLHGMREHDGRNNALFMAIGEIARIIYGTGGTRDDLLQIARGHNEQCVEPMEESEVSAIVGNVWRMTEQGRNHISQHGAWINVAEVETMVGEDQDALVLLMYLRTRNGPWGYFWVANGLADIFGWPRMRMAAARRRLIKLGHLVPVQQAGRGHPALYKWHGT
jgi:hypothetical protein